LWWSDKVSNIQKKSRELRQLDQERAPAELSDEATWASPLSFSLLFVGEVALVQRLLSILRKEKHQFSPDSSLNQFGPKA
jgi:hypothetical protein